MLLLLRPSLAHARLSQSCLTSRHLLRSFVTDGAPFVAGDYVILRQNRHASNKGVHERLIQLRADKQWEGHLGVVRHQDIIGKRSFDRVYSSRKADYTVLEPSLLDYVRLTHRVATPIYGDDAATITSLLDIHPPPPISDSIPSPPLEILEAGTGHGALTLYLSRAIHAANPSPPQAPTVTVLQIGIEDASYNGHGIEDVMEDTLSLWKRSRRAIVHTIDRRKDHSLQARKKVNGFRRGLYAGNVDFYVGDVSDWVANQFEDRGSHDPFLSHVVLDMPGAEDHTSAVAKALRPGGLLAIFNPSVTQIAQCEEAMWTQKLGLEQVQVIELSPARKWEVYGARPRVAKGLEGSRERSSSEDNTSEEQDRDRSTMASPASPEEKKLVMVCRPEFYGRTAGGGFVGLWRKRRPHSKSVPTDGPV